MPSWQHFQAAVTKTSRVWRRICSAAQATVLALACVANAAEGPPEDLASAGLDALLDLDVSGASKFSLRMSETASAVSMITADQMRALGHRTLADVLRSMRGVVVSSDRTYSYLGVRGFAAPGDYNTRILLLVDGNRVNDTVYDQAFIGSEFPLDLDLVERVEFIPGQGSAVHGANALFGVVNVVTRSRIDGSGGEAAVTLASGDSRQVRITGHRELGAATVMLSATALRERGRDVYYPGYDTPDAHSGISHQTDHERQDQLFTRIGFEDATVTLIHADRIRGLSASPGTVFNDPRTLYRDTQTLGDVSLRRRIDGLSHWNARLYAGSYSFRGDYAMDDAPGTLNRDGAQSRWWGLEGSVFTERVDSHKIVAGADVQVSPRRDQTNADISPVAVTYLDDHLSGRRFSLFGEDQWTLSPALSLTAGARWDHEPGRDGELNPRLAVVWRPGERWVTKFIHGTAYRPPNAFETRYATPGGYKSNPGLRAERVRGNEAVLEHRPDASTRWTMSAYANAARNLIVQAIDPADEMLLYDNLGVLRARGLELEGERAWPGGTHVRANYGWQDVRDPSGQGFERRAARHLGKLAVVLPLANDWTLGNETVVVAHRGEVPGYGVSNVTLSRASGRHGLRASLGVRDIFDRAPADPAGDSVLQPLSPQDGRSVWARIELAF